MENYDADPIIEHYPDPFPFDIENDPSFFQIKIDGKSTRVRTLVNRGVKNFGPGKKIIYVAEGRAISKAVSCVEIMKTYFKKPIYQITRINQIRTVETWRPLVEGLDPLCVTRAVPVIYILLSQERLPDDDDDNCQVYNHREPKKVLSMQLMEAHEASLEDIAENENGSQEEMSDQKENVPTDLNSEFTFLRMNEEDEMDNNE